MKRLTRAHKFGLGAYRGFRAEGYYWVACAWAYLRFFTKALRA